MLLLQQFPLQWLLPATLVLIAIAFVLAMPLYISLLRRSRWLFLALIVMFSVMTPGVFVPLPWPFDFITQEGLLAAGGHVLRLAAMLSLLAILLDKLDQRAIVAGLYVLLCPLAILGINRKRVSVRLLLVLDHVAVNRQDWRLLLHKPEPTLSTNALSLPIGNLRARDVVVASAVAAITIWGWLGW